MNVFVKHKAWICCLLGAVLMPSVSFGDDADPIVNLPAAEMGWEATGEGVEFAPLIGDRFKEPYMAMVRLPAGLISPAHTKTANMFGVVIEGVFQHYAVGSDDDNHVLLPAGSFYRIPAGVPHISVCASSRECVSFLYQDGKFDFIPEAP
ncbi:MAG: DUF4437 domain-containing protein [Pseudomonadota bacterium]